MKLKREEQTDKNSCGSLTQDKNEETMEKEKLNMGKMNEVSLTQDLSTSFLEGRGTSSFPSSSFPSSRNVT
jgi:hypothetical protein